MKIKVSFGTDEYQTWSMAYTLTGICQALGAAGMIVNYNNNSAFITAAILLFSSRILADDFERVT